MSNLLQYKYFDSISELQKFVNDMLLVDQVINVVSDPKAFREYLLIYWTPNTWTPEGEAKEIKEKL